MTTILPCCPRCQSIRIASSGWTKDDTTDVRCTDCGHRWEIRVDLPCTRGKMLEVSEEGAPMTKLTPDELKTLEQVAASGLQGKWSHIIGYGIGAAGHGCPKPLDNEGEINVDQRKAIESVNALPRLLAHIRTLESDLDAARRELESERIEKHAPTDNAPTRARILDIIRNAFGPRAGHGDCKRYAKGFKCCQICGATDELRTIAKDWKGHRITAARAANPMESKP